MTEANEQTDIWTDGELEEVVGKLKLSMSWKTAMNLYIMVLTDGEPAAQAKVHQELDDMARAMDILVSERSKLAAAVEVFNDVKQAILAKSHTVSPEVYLAEWITASAGLIDEIRKSLLGPEAEVNEGGE